jgi:BCD family chlorophyll transporter-like MFS transporter
MIRLLAVIACGTAGFGMADVLLEPFGGQVLGLSVGRTTDLTVALAMGSLLGFGLASRWIGRGGQPLTVAQSGAVCGVPAFGLVILSAFSGATGMFYAATLLAGFGAGLFSHGTLTATMRAAPRDQIGLALGAWGAVQTTAAGVAIAVGGVIRDAILAHTGTGTGSALPYIPVFSLEILLLLLALVLSIQLLRGRVDSTDAGATSTTGQRLGADPASP